MATTLPHPIVHRVELAQCPPLPWKNGGGVTRELLAWAPPAHPGIGNPPWNVRVSVADITQDGPFSSFPGIDRCFAVLEGEGVELDLPGGPHRQRIGDPPIAFAGEASIGCQLLRGPTRDLNLMGRRAGGRVTLLAAPPGSIFAAEAQWRGLFVFQTAEVQFDDSSPPQRLSAGTLCWSAAPGVRAAPRREQATPPWRLIAGDQAFWLALLPPETRS
jgi:environmental stress-induced protein Ves